MRGRGLNALIWWPWVAFSVSVAVVAALAVGYLGDEPVKPRPRIITVPTTTTPPLIPVTTTAPGSPTTGAPTVIIVPATTTTSTTTTSTTAPKPTPPTTCVLPVCLPIGPNS